MKTLRAAALALLLCVPTFAGVIYPGYGPCYPGYHDNCPPCGTPDRPCPESGTTEAASSEGGDSALLLGLAVGLLSKLRA